MIFATLGTHHHPFSRLAQWLERACGDGAIAEEEEVVLQYGYTTPPGGRIVGKQFLAFPEMMRLFEEADLTVTHASTTAILVARSGKLPMVVPRSAQFGECVDGHQLAFVEETKDVYPFYTVLDYEGFRRGLLNRADVTRIPESFGAGGDAAIARLTVAVRKVLCGR